jgi:predicted transcriptional regulator
VITAEKVEEVITLGLGGGCSAREIAERVVALITPAEVAALRHPLRQRLLEAIAAMEETSPCELAGLVGAPLGNVSYHVRKLATLGLIEQTRTVPRRGAVEHYYRVAGAANGR